MTSFQKVVVADQATSMSKLLIHLGYEIYRLPQQISCPVHKFGIESRNSARVYESDSFVWCFKCSKNYRPTEIWEAKKSTSRVEAAEAILQIWPVDPEKTQQILRDLTTPPRIPVSNAMHLELERHLLNYRGRASWELYRRWAWAVDRVVIQLSSMPVDAQLVAFQSFLERMKLELGSAP